MAFEMSALAPFEPRLRSLARIIIGFTFSLHGWQKAFGAFGGLGGTTPPLSSMLGAAGVIETIGGALIILGLFTTPVAFLLAGEMAVGYSARTRRAGCGRSPMAANSQSSTVSSSSGSALPARVRGASITPFGKERQRPERNCIHPRSAKPAATARRSATAAHAGSLKQIHQRQQQKTQTDRQIPPSPVS